MSSTIYSALSCRMGGLYNRHSPNPNISYQNKMRQRASLKGLRSFSATLTCAPIQDSGQSTCSHSGPRAVYVRASSPCFDKSSLLTGFKTPRSPTEASRRQGGQHTHTSEVEESIVADWKYTSSHYESHSRSLAQAPAHKPHPSRGLPLPNDPMSIFRLNFFLVLFDYTDARPSLLPKLEDEKCPGVSFSKCTWAAWVICCHQIDARSENTNNEQTFDLNSSSSCRSRCWRTQEAQTEAAILTLSISFTVCHCDRRITYVACVCAGWAGWRVWIGWRVHLRASSGVRPDTSTHVSRASGEVISGGARGHGDDTVLVTLQHDLGISGSGIPELHPSVLGP